MTTYGPPSAAFSLFERLVAAPVVLTGRVQGLTDQWADPSEGRAWVFGLLDVEVHQALRGEVPDRISVRVAGTRGEKEVEWNAPIGAGDTVLLLLAEDEEGNPPRYGLQYGSAFRLHEDILEVPDDLALGEYAEEPGRLPLKTVERMLGDIYRDAAERRKSFEEVEGPGWDEREYPEVEEVGDPLEEEQPAPAPGPREGAPAGDGTSTRR